jgi:hypothetical protein
MRLPPPLVSSSSKASKRTHKEQAEDQAEEEREEGALKLGASLQYTDLADLLFGVGPPPCLLSLDSCLSSFLLSL